MVVAEREIWASIWKLAWISVATYFGVLFAAFVRDVIRWVEQIKVRRWSAQQLQDKVLNLYSDYTNVFSVWHVFRLLANAAVCVIYVISTYQKTVSGPFLLANRVLAGFFMFEIARSILFEPSAVRYVATFGRFFSIFSIPSLLLAAGPSYYLHFGFLRAIAAHNAFNEIERGLIQRYEYNRMRMRICFQFLTLFYVLGCGIQLLEFPGDLVGADAKVEEWHFFNCFYFVIVTLSTVGFGDMSPATLQGRIYTIAMIIVGIIIFTNIGEELRKDTRRQRSINKYNPVKEKRHVIVSGTPTIQEFKHFVTEYFWGDGSFLNRFSNIVVLLEEEDWDDDIWYTEIAHNPFLRLHITYLVGSVQNPLVLQRAGIESANAFFILTSPASGDTSKSHASFHPDGSRRVQLADTKTVMMTLAVRNVRSDIPIFGQTLLDDSNDQVIFALTTASNQNDPDLLHRPDTGVAKYSAFRENLTKIKKEHFRDKEEPEDQKRNAEEVAQLDLERSGHVCLQQLYTALMVANIKANGVSTLITNLHIEYKDESKENYSDYDEIPWLGEYAMGSECSLLNAFIPDRFVESGTTVQQVAPALFEHGIVVVGKRHKSDLKTDVLLNLNEKFVADGIYLFLTFLDQKSLFLALDKVGGELEDVVKTTSESEPPSTDIGDIVHSRNIEDGTSSNTTESTEEEELETTERVEEEDTSKKPLHIGQDSFLSHDQQQIDWENHVIIAVEGQTPRDHLLYFLRKLNPSRNRNIDVVILQPRATDEYRHALKMYHPRLRFVEGKPASQASWKLANFEHARAVVTLSDYSLERKSADAQAIYTLLALDSMTEPEHKVFICSELIDEQSIELLRQPSRARRKSLKLGLPYDDVQEHGPGMQKREGDNRESSSDAQYSCMGVKTYQGSAGKLLKPFSKSESDISNATRSHRDYLFSRYRYTSGELLVHSTADSLLVREYAEPGFIDFIKGLVGGREQRPDESTPAEQKIQLFSLPPAIFGKEPEKEFKELFVELIKLGVTPLGLYRSGDAHTRVPKRKRWKRKDRYPNIPQGPTCFGRPLSMRKLPNCRVSESEDLDDLDEPRKPGNKLPYVFTLPAPGTMVAPNDAVYVLCDPTKVEDTLKRLGWCNSEDSLAEKMLE